MESRKMKICAISDIHNRHNKVTIEPCDILIVAGDYTGQGLTSEVKNFHKWLNNQPARHKLVVQGNHELYVQSAFANAKMTAQEECPDVIFVEHELVEIEGLKIFCSAWTPFFHNWAYNAERTLEDACRNQIPFIGDKWKDIPMDTDILVTHGPPAGILDQCYYADGVTPRERVGCYSLLEKLVQIPTLKHHFFGHIHSSHGEQEFKGIKFYNVSICGETYYPDYPPTVIEV